MGVVLDLGYCLDLLDSKNLDTLKVSYKYLKDSSKEFKLDLPKNIPVKSGELLLRFLDCAVIEAAHKINILSNMPEYDSVRGVFMEGKELYENAGFREKNHIQICIRNQNCIKGFFIPRELKT